MRQQAPAAARNREPIAAILGQELPDEGTVLEIASGTGEHALYFAERFPSLVWQPTDADPQARASITAWREGSNFANLLEPLPLDASADLGAWPLVEADAAVCINMIHISPWASTQGLFQAAVQILPKGAPLILYGPYIEDDVATAASNVAFDQSLKARNPAWGLRNLGRVDELAHENGITRTRRVEMPANNLMLVYRKD